jgi:hypothetical protein
MTWPFHRAALFRTRYSAERRLDFATRSQLGPAGFDLSDNRIARPDHRPMVTYAVNARGVLRRCGFVIRPRLQVGVSLGQHPYVGVDLLELLLSARGDLPPTWARACDVPGSNTQGWLHTNSILPIRQVSDLLDVTGVVV